MKYPNDALLIDCLKKGEEDAYVFIIDHYGQRLFAYALTLTNDSAMAQDILQNVFLRTWEKRKRIKVLSSLQNYLFKSVHNEFINLYKHRKSKMVLEQKYFDALAKTTAAYDENVFAKLIDKVSSEIQNLPPKCRQVFILSRKEGLTNIEISEYLNISIKTVEAHVTKAFSILRKRLGDKIEINLFFLFGYNRSCHF